MMFFIWLIKNQLQYHNHMQLQNKDPMAKQRNFDKVETQKV